MSNKEGSLGDRMKGYENVFRLSLVKRTPAIIRIDGRAFHTFTKGMDRPFDQDLIESMWAAAKVLCSEIDGCKLAYVQSDEISLLLIDYENLGTQGWFGYSVQKMASVSASIATNAFNEALRDRMASRLLLRKSATFDSRVFNMPREEVVNYFIWRQQDWTRNSITMLARAYFSHKQITGKSCSELQEMLFSQKDLNWNDLPTYLKRGACIIRRAYTIEGGVIRHEWVEDLEIPIFTQDRSYIERYVYPENESPKERPEK